LTLVRADGIQPYWYVHIYTGIVALLDRIQSSFSIITISTISYRAATAGGQYQWYLLSRTPKHKPVEVMDTYNTIHQVSTQIDTLPEVMLTTALTAWGKIMLLRRLYRILMGWRGRFLIGRQFGLWMVLLVGHLMVRQCSLMTVLGLHKMMLTDWGASRRHNTDHSQSYGRSRMDSSLSGHGKRSRRMCLNYHRG